MTLESLDIQTKLQDTFGEKYSISEQNLICLF